MKVYTKTTHAMLERPAGTRIEAEVIRTVDGFRVGEFRFVDSPPHGGGWVLMNRSYASLWRLLRAVCRAGYYVDGKSAGIE